MSTTRRRSVLAATTCLLVLVTFAVSATNPSARAGDTATTGVSVTPPSAPRLPRPTGRHPVGMTSLHLKDFSRPDPWVPTVTARELMVSLWYPAKATNGRRVRYLTPRESELILQGALGTPSDVLSGTRTNAISDAEPVESRYRLPLVVLSPGFTWPRSSLSALAEDLASWGYVVVGIDHTYETFATTFPDGRVTTCAACQLEDVDDFGRKAEESRAADVAFVLDELTGPRSMWKGGGLLDPSRIAIAGSSLGGASSSEVMLRDPRVRAGINMDGHMFAPLPPGGLSRPFLFLGQQSFHSPGSVDDTTWDANWPLLTGWKRWIVVAGSVHASFTDYDLLAEQIGVDLGSDLTGLRTVEITRRYVRAYFDLHLRGAAQPLLDGPSARYPEIRFCAPPATTCTA
jgi:dienelactone hydrolase